eukprot:TRINITY_DN7525_c1_g1_i1.p1 TRINITY_DN7525_c1_g1~~TRINITY_DN7525_c1_g1_i1.p1  ORF type:complete len:689 (+),score=104.41 TRINITY_DN7525_c1_g1_i1:194-2068(+)
MAAGQGWVDVLLHCVSATEPDLQPRPDSSYVNSLLVIAYTSFFNVFIMNLMIGIMVDAYMSVKSELAGHTEMTSKEVRLWEFQRSIFFNPEIVLPKDPMYLRGLFMNQQRTWILHNILLHPYCEKVILAGVIFNSVIMLLENPTSDTQEREMLDNLAGSLLLVFTLELLLKIFVYGPDVLKDKWIVFDMIAVLGSDVGVIIVFAINLEGEIFTQLRSGLQIARMLMLAKYTWFLDSMVKTIFAALPFMIHVSMLLILVIFMYASMGIGLFGTMMDPPGHDGAPANFHSLGDALMLLLRVSTGERWHELMYQFASDPPGCINELQSPEDLARDGPRGCGSVMSYAYFNSFFIIVFVVLMNLIVSVMLESYSTVHGAEEMFDFKVCLTALRDRWLARDPEFQGYLPVDDVCEILMSLPEPVGVKAKRKHLLNQMLYFEVHDGRTLAYRDIIILVAQRSLIYLSGLSLTECKPWKARLDPEVLEEWMNRFPALAKVLSRQAVTIAHCIVSRKIMIFVKKKRYEWKHKGTQGNVMLQMQSKAARKANPDGETPTSPLSGAGSPAGSPAIAAAETNQPREPVAASVLLPAMELASRPAPPLLSPLQWPPSDLTNIQQQRPNNFDSMGYM